VNIEIRPATAADVAAIARFNVEMARETEHRPLDLDRVTRGVAALLADAAKGAYYVAALDQEVVGQLLITFEWSDWRNGNFWWIQSVYVKQDLRGRGAFKALFEHVRQLAAARPGEVCGLRLYMDQDNAVAREVYQRLGLLPTRYQVFELDFALRQKLS
jgi:ribosomal protein S18 acetylase RimI-like enzyme